MTTYSKKNKRLSVKTYCSCQVGIGSQSVDSTKAQRWDPEVKLAARTI